MLKASWWPPDCPPAGGLIKGLKLKFEADPSGGTPAGPPKKGHDSRGPAIESGPAACHAGHGPFVAVTP